MKVDLDSPTPGPEESTLARYRPWLLAASAYNVAWGSLTVLVPTAVWDLIGAPAPNYLGIWQVTGLFVLLFGLAYWWAARDPFRHRHLVVIGLIGKILGPIGFAWAVAPATCPWPLGSRSSRTTSSGFRPSSASHATRQGCRAVGARFSRATDSSAPERPRSLLSSQTGGTTDVASGRGRAGVFAGRSASHIGETTGQGLLAWS